MLRKFTKWFIGIVFALIVIVDVLLLVIGGVDSTISRVLIGWSVQLMILPFAVGVLCGHLFWPQRIKGD